MKNLAPEIFRQRLLIEGFNEEAAISFTKEFFNVKGEMTHQSI
jgi:hypothetical protein